MAVEKYVYRISSSLESPILRHGVKIDEALIGVLSHQKHMINDYYENRKWDRHKKQSNPYELVFTTTHPSIANINPLSRSFFKHWEMLQDFKEELEELHDLRKPLVCAFLAEGPGGFIEAFTKLRGDRKEDRIYGVTLISSDRNVPSWKLSREMQAKHNIKLLFGVDGDGSLYSLGNILSFVETIGANECDYVTADGGFDFSNDFDLQENASCFLIVAEILTAMMLLKKGGHFLLKIFDITLPITRVLLYILFENFESITFTKPLTSRPANSEKYVLCKGFLSGEDKNQKSKNREKVDFVDVLKETIKEGPRGNRFQLLLDRVIPTNEFLESIAFYNIIYVVKQITHINTTLSYIYSGNEDETTLYTQLQYAVRWCHKYKIPINLAHLRLKANQIVSCIR